MAQIPPSDLDDYMRTYLAQTNLSGLDLHDIDLHADAEAERAWQWGRLTLSAGLAALVLWAMNTGYYQFHADGTLLVPLAWIGLLATLAAALREAVALQQGRQKANTTAWVGSVARLAGARRVRWQLSAQAQRYLLLLMGLGLGGGVLFTLPRDAEWRGNGYSSAWFLGVGAAIVAGICLGRWLIAQADAQPATVQRPPAAPFVWPKWTKWATLALLVSGGLFATFGHLLLRGGDSNTVGFELSGLGLFVGIFGAIWIARRFDEWEAELRHTAEAKVPPDAR